MKTRYKTLEPTRYKTLEENPWPGLGGELNKVSSDCTQTVPCK